ncbi:hypothetical protein [Chitinophaga sp. LS1]|uniref:hypothetical protein n=1 Tax=Chitinophaga sp. LS1 TaxID=3051176 RepID=UPI002AAB391C|nr:hypothetical protein [Chitinophaga sp. LS1]WPV64190.1 hypothetical protein QQL36_20520 [Chitinophaga sp. LS1]
MEYNEIRGLLIRYWEGETSLEEEDLLRSFFAENRQGLPADLQEAAPLFGYFAAEAGKEVPEMGWEILEGMKEEPEVAGEMAEEVREGLEVAGKMPEEMREVPEVGSQMPEAVREVPEVNAEVVEENTSRSTVVVSMPRPYQHWMKYAAVLLLGVGLVYSGRQFKTKQEEGRNPDRMAQALNQADTYEDSKEAYAATKKALELLAKNLNKGTAQAKKIAYFNEATEYIKAD